MNLPKSIQTHAGLLAHILGSFHAAAYQGALLRPLAKQLGDLLGLIDLVSASGAQLQGVMQSAADLKEIYNRGEGGFSSRDDQQVVTCVYCGQQYPDGTPTSQPEILTAHIKVCEKHPMREAEARIERLRKALSALIGVETKVDLEAMEVATRMMPGIEADKIDAINAIHVLLAELNAKDSCSQ
jgi:hypothetical protein